MSEKDSFVKFENVDKSYDGESLVVKGLNLDIPQGEFLTMLGPSGSGKTTTLMMLAGFETPTSGEIYLGGEPISSIPPNKRGIGMVFQNYALFPHMTVNENLAFPLEVRKLEKSEVDEKVHKALSMVELQDFGTRMPLQLSGGQQQRVALARALAPSPDILLMDEPFSNIDEEIKEELVSDIRVLLKQLKITSIIVTHDQYEAFNLADKVSIINNGKIQQVGNSYDIYHKPKNKFVADFIGLGVFMPVKKTNSNDFEIPIGILDHTKIKDDLLKYKNPEMLIRPDDIIHNDSSDLKAVVLEKQFRGAEFLYRLLYNEKYPLLCYAPSHHNHEIGESIGIELDMEHYVIFEK